MDAVSIGIAGTALAVSITNAYLTLFRRGTVRMTQPTTIYFGPDGSAKHSPLPKVYLRTLLYSTSKRGQIIESMFVKLHRGESVQTFNIWVYGEDSLARGSGLYVGENGVVCDHHFLLPKDGTQFDFLQGEYKLEIYASLVNRSQSLLLASVKLSVSDRIAEQLQDKEYGAYFDWGPDSRQYHPHPRQRPKLLPDKLLELQDELTQNLSRKASQGE
jgi:hypothetical protein